MLELKNISRSYPGFRLEDISMQVDKGSYFVLLGPSGAGKTQVLEIISGLVKPGSGQVMVDGKEVTASAARHRPLGIVFQDRAIFPHLSVEKNIAYGLKNSLVSSAETGEIIRAQAKSMGIGHLLKRKPAGLSGGELQRVALARTLARNPAYLLLDEPLSSLDVQLRQELLGLLKKIHRQGQTILHVTHDFEETLVLATHVAVMHQGRIIQSGTRDEVFHRPGSEFVARFTGIKNYFPARLQTIHGKQTAILPSGTEIRIITDQPDGDGFVLIPGEEIILSQERFDSSATNQIRGNVVEIIHVPRGAEVTMDAGNTFYAKITHESLEHLQLSQGSEAWLSFKASGVRFVRT